MEIEFDHVVIHVSDWERSNAFYRDVIGAEVIANGRGFAYRLGRFQFNCHGPNLDGNPKARLPVMPGNSDICFTFQGSVENAAAHLHAHNVEIELGPVRRFGAGGDGTSLYFRDPDGSLMEFIVYT